MNPRKNVLSYIIWLVFSVYMLLIMTAYSFAVVNNSVYSRYITQTYQKALLFLGVVAVFALIFVAVHALSITIKKHVVLDKSTIDILSIVAPIFILLGVVALMAYYLVNNMPITLSNEIYYKQAVVNGKDTGFVVHGMSYLYVNILRTLFLIFGNNPFAGIVMQIVFFFALIVLVYITCVRVCGVIPACIGMALIGLVQIQTFLSEVFSLTPELMYLCLYFLGVLFISGIVKGISEEKLQGFLGGFAIYLLGIYIGYLIYLDIFSLTLLFFIFGMISMKQIPKKVSVLGNVVTLLGMINGVAIALLVLYIQEGILPITYLSSLWELYFASAKFVHIGFVPVENIGIIILFLLLLFGCIPGYVIQIYDRYTTWIACFFVLIICQMFSVNRLEYQSILTVFACILAGVGLYGYVKTESESVTENTETETNEQETENISEDSQETLIASEADTNVVQMPETTLVAEPKTEAKVEPGMPLDNPLPLPKKHVKKSVDFPYQFEESQLTFDHDTDENDDFDYE